MANDEDPFRVESGVLDLEFRSLPCGRADIRSVPILPGGHLTGRFAFQSNLREDSGAYLRPDFGLVWELTSGKADVSESKFGGDGVACVPCTITPRVAVSLFDQQTGKGTAQFDVPMFGWVMGTPLSEGENRLTLYLAPRNQMKREWDGPPQNWTHRFDPVELAGRLPDLSVNLHAMRLRRGEGIEVTIVRPQSAESGPDFAVSVEPMPGGSAGGFLFPSRVSIVRGEISATFRVSFGVGQCSNSGGFVRVRVRDDAGHEAFSLPLNLIALNEAPPGLSRTGPLTSDTNWFQKCTKKAAPFNLPPGAVWVDVGPCNARFGVPAPPPPPPVPGGPVLLYTPYECSFSDDFCTVFANILNGTIYNKVTFSVPCFIWSFVGPRPGHWVRVNGLQSVTVYTAIGPGMAVVDDCF